MLWLNFSIYSVISTFKQTYNTKRPQSRGATYILGSPAGSLELTSRIHRHHQRSPVDIVPCQEARYATFFDLGTRSRAYSSKATRKLPRAFAGGGLLSRAWASTVASSIPNEDPKVKENQKSLQVTAFCQRRQPHLVRCTVVEHEKHHRSTQRFPTGSRFPPTLAAGVDFE